MSLCNYILKYTIAKGTRIITETRPADEKQKGDIQKLCSITGYITEIDVKYFDIVMSMFVLIKYIEKIRNVVLVLQI